VDTFAMPVEILPLFFIARLTAPYKNPGDSIPPDFLFAFILSSQSGYIVGIKVGNGKNFYTGG